MIGCSLSGFVLWGLVVRLFNCHGLISSVFIGVVLRMRRQIELL